MEKTTKKHIPTYDEIVECERKILKFFGWDLGFVLVIHYVEMFLANGVLFESEEHTSKMKAKQISDETYKVLEEMIK